MAPPSEQLEALRRLDGARRDAPLPFGRYDVLGRLGRGGIGAVFEAHDRERGVPVALKLLARLDARGHAELKHEFRTMANVGHRNLVTLYELGRHEDLWYLTMELIRGTSWVRWVRGQEDEDASASRASAAPEAPTREARGRPTRDEDERTVELAGDVYASMDDTSATRLEPASLERLRGALGQLVTGVRALHERGLVHLDLKPANVLVEDGGRVVILDFGLVRALDDATLDASAKGTLLYMAPEQMSGEPVGEAADWYAVGVMLFRGLTGRRPFAGTDPTAVYRDKMRGAFASPQALVSGVPYALDRLCTALLAPRPEDRPSGADVARALTEGTAPVPRRAPRTPEALVGREAELAELASAYDRALSKGPELVELRGPSGIGKSALLRRFADRVRARGEARVLDGRCYERETVPFKAFDGAIDALAAELRARPREAAARLVPRWIGELARAFPVLFTVDELADRAGLTTLAIDPNVRWRRTAGALVEILEALAKERPLVLAIDDLQWADEDSARLLAAILEAPPSRFLLVLSRRSEAERAPPVVLTREAIARSHAIARSSIELGPLSPRDAERLGSALLAEMGVADTDARAASIARESSGVPIFVEELARYTATRAPASGEPALELALAERLRGLAPEARAVLEVAAMAGRPTPQSVVLKASGLEAQAVWALIRLRGAGLLKRAALDPEDLVELYHDRIREAVIGTMGAELRAERSLALARALAARRLGATSLFEAARHFGVSEGLVHDHQERERAARLQLEAGQQAQQGAAFPLALGFHEAGLRFVGAEGWTRAYALTLQLHVGACEAAYASSRWEAFDRHVAELSRNARDVLDALPARELAIDARIARLDFAGAIADARSLLDALGAPVPETPTADEVSAAVDRAMNALAAVGEAGLLSLPDAVDVRRAAALRVTTHLVSAAYFASPGLLPLLAAELVAGSIAHGLTPATPYALSIFGVVLNGAGRYAEAHAWGRAAIALIDRFEDRRLEARTRHVALDLVCAWTVPLASTLEELGAVPTIAKESGDLEYGAYASHAFVHQALYACQPLEGLASRAREVTAQLRATGQDNALLVHAPFAALVACFLGERPDPARLDGPDFAEAAALARAEELGSRSAMYLVRLLMGIARYHFGDAREASVFLEGARRYADGVASTWHLPIQRQYAALARLAQGELAIDEDLAALAALAEIGPANFAHKVALLEGAREAARGAHDAAREPLARAAALAEAQGFWSDAGLALELAAKSAPAAERGPLLERARAAYERWGARAKLARLEAR